MDCVNDADALEPFAILRALFNVPFWHHVVGVVLFLAYVAYNFLEIHLIGDLIFSTSRNSVRLTCDPDSEIATQLLPKCKILEGRYWPTPWLCSPHLQTAFLHFFGRPPVFGYQRQIFLTPDGETIALDWLINNAIKRPASVNTTSSGNDVTPIVIVIPGLTSDSKDPYVKHIVYALAKKGWKTVVANHRGLGGTSITSDRFYNAGWTEDLRRIVGYLHHENPKAPLLAVGTSIGANILVKYLGEEGNNTPLAGAAAICCPWDLVVCDRFINRSLVQRLYNKILTTGLQGYAQMHQSTHARIADWECVKKSRSVRDFDNYFTCRISKYSTVDTYYRKCSSAHFLSNVSVPLLCVNALDDPVCTREAIPWDECRVNKNVVLATTLRGGHLAYFEGLTAISIWWVRAVNEFLSVLHSSSLMHSVKQASGFSPTLPFPIDKGPYLNVYHDGMVSAQDTSSMQSQKNGEDLGEEKVYLSLESSTKILDQNQCTDDKKLCLALDSYQYVKDSKLANDSNKDESIFEECSSEDQLNLEKGISEEESKFSKGRNEEEFDLKHSNEKGPTFTICIEGGTEYIALQSALQQVLEQMQASSKGEDMSNAGVRNAESNVLFQSTAFKEPVHASAVSHLAMCNSDAGVCENVESGSSIKQSVQKQRGGNDVSKKTMPTAKRMMHLSRLQRGSIWVLAYIALVTAWPLVGSALMLYLRKRFKNVWGVGWARK